MTKKKKELKPIWRIKAQVIDTTATTRRSGPAPPSCCCPCGSIA